MHTDISKFAIKLPEDNLSKFFSSLDISVSGFGTWDQTGISSITNFMITDYEIVYLLKGKTRVTYEGNTCECNVGDCIFLEPFRFYSAECISSENVQYMYIHFNVEPYIVQQELLQMLKGSGAPLYTSETFKSFYTMFSNICTPSERALEGHALMLKFALIRILLAMVRDRRDLSVKYERHVINSQEAEIINRSVEYVLKNLDKPIKISQIAIEIGVSENKIYKSFMDILKISPSKYFMQVKIKKAKQLIKSTTMTIDEISFITGFSSAFHFSKTFKDTLGVSPSYFRKGNIE